MARAACTTSLPADFIATAWTSAGGSSLEKMLYDNTELLRNYVHGFQILCAKISWRRQRDCGLAGRDMTDRARADLCFAGRGCGLDDDGDYFTWTVDEAKAVLDLAEWDLRQLLGIGELGDCTTTRPRMFCM